MSQRYPLFTEAHSAQVVNARMTDAADPRLRQVMDTIVRHLHEAVKEIEPTHEEWAKAIQFLTETGHMCTDWRQEFILLSDILGVCNQPPAPIRRNGKHHSGPFPCQRCAAVQERR